MLAEQLHKEWRAREEEVPISPVMTLAPEGLLLGAGTVLVPADGARRLQALEGQEARLLALLSAASGTPVAPLVLGHIERAAKCWQRGDDALAAIHLALSGLHLPQDRREAACRLFVADALMKAGASPRTILEALDLKAPFVDAVEKFFNPLEPRVLSGSPHPGEWTRGASALADITGEQAGSLGLFALRLLGLAGAAATAFGLVFIPSPNNTRVEGEVAGLPRGRYVWNRDEMTLRLTYDGADGQEQTVLARKGADGVFRDQRGTEIGRALPDGTVAFDQRVLPSAPAKENEPRLCPVPEHDKLSGIKGWDYQEYVANFVNPGNPTGRGWGYELLQPNGKPVSYDDCQHSTGIMVDAKGPMYAWLLGIRWVGGFVLKKLWGQANRQVDAAGPRPVRWYFAEPEAADRVKKYFADEDQGAEKIEIRKDLPWPTKKQ